MKRISLLLSVFALIAFLAFTGCATPETITGVWIVSSGYSSGYADETFEFTADKMIRKFNLSNVSYNVTYTYKMEAGVITVNNDGKSLIGVYIWDSPFLKSSVSVNTSEMTWSNPDTLAERYKFKKK